VPVLKGQDVIKFLVFTASPRTFLSEAALPFAVSEERTAARGFGAPALGLTEARAAVPTLAFALPAQMSTQ